MNRGGLRGSAFEMDDRYTAYHAGALVRDGLDFSKVLVRVDLEDPATVVTLEATAKAVDACAAAGIAIMLEPFMSGRRDGKIVNDLSTDAVINSVAIASGLGGSSAYTWLKLPVADDMERVMAATTLPTLLLGGDPSTDPETVYASWKSASPCRVCTAWSWAAPCCTRRTETSRPPSTPPPPSYTVAECSPNHPPTHLDRSNKSPDGCNLQRVVPPARRTVPRRVGIGGGRLPARLEPHRYPRDRPRRHRPRPARR